MSDYLTEISPPYFDLQSKTLKLSLSEDCSICVVNISDALRGVSDHMPNLNSVRIFVNQKYLFEEDLGNFDKKEAHSVGKISQRIPRRDKDKNDRVSFPFGLMLQ